MGNCFRSSRLILIVFTVLLTAACKKHDAHAAGDWLLTLPGNTELKSSVIKTIREQRNGYEMLSAYENKTNSSNNILHFWFSKWPTTSTSYTVVHYTKLTGSLQPNEMVISIDYPSMPSTFFSTGLKYAGYSDQPADPVSVSVIGDQLQVTIPQMCLFDTLRTHDSAYVQGTIREN